MKTPAKATFSAPRRGACHVLALAVGLVLAAAGAAAQDRKPPAAAPMPAPSSAAVPATASAGTVVREQNLTQLGIDFAIQLHGIDGTVGIPFNVRADEFVSAAALRLNYAYSPALIPELSHLRVTVNDVLVATLPVNRADAGKPQSVEIPIDRRLITEFNRINVQLIGHYTRECEDPAHSSLWATVDASSTLRLTVAPLALRNDLARLPEPFFDRRDVQRLRLPFVFASAQSPNTLEAAGIVSSWFGGLAAYRGATFPVSRGELPTGNAVVFALPDASVAGLTLPAIQGPALAVVDNPQSPGAKLLLVMGRDPAELRTAAASLALDSRALTGEQALVTHFEEPPPRKPYDAPRWLPSDRPVLLGELAPADGFSVRGYMPDVIRVNMQLPPDLFMWRNRGIPLDLRYRYTPRLRPDQSTLNVNVNDNFIGALPLRAANPGGDHWWNPLAIKVLPDGSLAQEKEIRLPPLAMTSRSQLRLHYYFQPSAGHCEPLLDNAQGAIDPSSSINISGLPHYIAMPDLAAYANGGFPFTRMADLSQTAVILPDRIEDADTQTYLGLLGQIGYATGYPALRVKVGRADELPRWADKDLLVIGNLQNQPLFKQWADRMPLQGDGAARQFRFEGWVDDALSLITARRQRDDLPGDTQISLSDGSRDALISGFESPLRAGRSVVAVVGTADTAPAVLDALMTPELLRRIQGSAALIRDKQVHSLLGGDTYYTGRLPPFTWLQWRLSRNPLMLALLVLAVALVGGAVAYASLQLRARRRLR